MNPFYKLLLKLTSSDKIDMEEDYIWIRKMQQLFSKIKIEAESFDFLDDRIHAENGKHEIPIRIFYPEETTHADEYIIYIHGGGWVLGDIDTYSQACVNLANALGRIVYSIDYRLAPEHPYPSGLNDCYRAVNKLISPRHAAKRKWILMGDSAGGNLVSSVTLKLIKEKQLLPEHTILLYPLTYWDHSDNSPFASIREYGEDHGLTSKKMQEYMNMYAPNVAERKNPAISPLLAEDFTGYPDTLIVTAEFDPLRDEGEAYGVKLDAAGNQVEMHRIPEMVHGFITFPVNAYPLPKVYKIINQYLEKKSKI